MMFRSTLIALGAMIAFSGCADPELAAKVGELETKVAELEKQVEKGGAARAPGRAPSGVDPEAEQAAGAKLREISAKVDELDFAAAKTMCDEAMKQYGATQTFQRRGRVCQEVAVVGKDAADLEVEKWFQGEASMADSDATLLVFWEQWCPHCKREVPEIEATYKKYQGKLNVVGLTKVNRSSTDEKVAAFIEEKGLSYPMAKEKGGNLSRYYNVSGVPAAALVKDGKVVWRGHPAVLNRNNTLEKLLEG